MNKFRLLPTSVYIKSSLGDPAKASLYTPMPTLSLRCSTGDDFHSAVFYVHDDNHNPNDQSHHNLYGDFQKIDD